jgi:hypothetical protein
MKSSLSSKDSDTSGDAEIDSIFASRNKAIEDMVFRLCIFIGKEKVGKKWWQALAMVVFEGVQFFPFFLSPKFGWALPSLPFGSQIFSWALFLHLHNVVAW